MSEGIILSQGGGGVTVPFALGLSKHARVCRGEGSNGKKKTNTRRELTMALHLHYTPVIGFS